jgi:hypothetical protein
MSFHRLLLLRGEGGVCFCGVPLPNRIVANTPLPPHKPARAPLKRGTKIIFRAPMVSPPENPKNCLHRLLQLKHIQRLFQHAKPFGDIQRYYLAGFLIAAALVPGYQFGAYGNNGHHNGMDADTLRICFGSS